MKINYNNRDIIGSKATYMHDSKFEKIDYNYSSNMLHVLCNDYYKNNKKEKSTSLNRKKV